MNKKISTIVLIIIAIITIIVSFNYFPQKKTTPIPLTTIKPTQTTIPPLDTQAIEYSETYDNLAIQCDSKDSKNCCLSSVDAIIKGNYILEPNTGCPSGTQRNMMKCESTLIWCEPIK
jgi:hypothetical protein